MRERSLLLFCNAGEWNERGVKQSWIMYRKGEAEGVRRREREEMDEE